MLIIAVVLGGCPYKSDIPVDAVGKKINPALLGVWEPKSSGDEKYTIAKENETTYKITKTSKNSKEPTVYKGHIVDVDGTSYLNLQQQGEMADKGYYIYKVEVNAGGNKVTLQGLTENITETFKTGDEFKAFIKKYKGLSFFYDKQEDVYNKD
jgi:hypothetical protein